MSNDESTPDEHAVTDLYFAAYLRSKGLVMIDMLRTGRQVTWVFQLPKGTTIKRLSTLWFAGDEVPALEYSNAVKALKSSVAGV